MDILSVEWFLWEKNKKRLEIDLIEYNANSKGLLVVCCFRAESLHTVYLILSTT